MLELEYCLVLFPTARLRAEVSPGLVPTLVWGGTDLMNDRFRAFPNAVRWILPSAPA